MAKETLILVDGSSYLFRAYYALPALTSPDGKPTGAVYGVINMLKKLVSDYPTHNIAVVFDSKGKNFRHEIFPKYKANRAAMPEDLAVQIEPLHQIIQDLGFPLIKQKGIEADDIIGTLAKQAEAKGYNCIISTGDKDFAQLVNENITLVNTMTMQEMDIAGVEEKFGVKAEQIIDYLALVGDSVDNIPGIPKVGPKTAVKWLAQYGDIDNLVKHAEEIKGKIGENLRNNLEQLELSRELVTIKCDMEVEAKLAEIDIGDADEAKLHKWYKKLGFKRWLNEIDGVSSAGSSAAPEVNIMEITAVEELEAMFTELLQEQYVVVKTYGYDEFSAYAFAYNDKDSYYVSSQQQDLVALIQEKLTVFNGTVIGYNLKHDIESPLDGMLAHKKIVDVMLQEYVIGGNNKARSIADLARHVLGYSDVSMIDTEPKKVFVADNHDAQLKLIGTEVFLLLKLYHEYTDKIIHNTWAERVLRHIDFPLVPVLAQMEETGILLDCDILAKQSVELDKKLTKCQKDIFLLSGEEFNIDSPKQLQVILFDKLNCPVIKKTPKGVPSTNEEVLQQLAEEFPIAELILEYRGMRKLKNTYVDKLPQEVAADGRVHTNYNQTGTITGRLSSNNPNLQNIPIKSLEGRRIRQAFVAKKGYSIVAADYSQVELRIMAHIAEEAALIDAFKHGLDIHAATAAEIFDVDVKNVTAEQRRRAKAVNFGLIYGMSAFGLAKQINVPRKDAQYYIDKYFEHYPGVLEYMNNVRELAAKDGYVETIFGRRIFMPNMKNKNPILRKAAERAAINAPMQGSASDIIKVAMIDIQNEINNNKLDMQMLLQVHDELVFEIKNSDLDAAKELITNKMEAAANLNVGLKVAVGVGKNWDEAH